MSLSRSPLWYGDCYEAMERALEDTKGVRLRVDTEGDANFLRMRLNQARVINREENLRTYAPDHPMYGRSAYDRLIFKVQRRKDKNGLMADFVYLLQVDGTMPEIELLSELEPEVEASKVAEPIEVQTLSKPKSTNIIPMVVKRTVLVRRI